MTDAHTQPEPHHSEWPRRWRRRLFSLWPHWPLAIALMVAGGINVLVGIRYHTTLLAEFKTLSTVGQSLSVLGSRTQTLLGAALMVVGFGLFWRLSSAWAFGVLLLAITLGVNLVQGQTGATIILPAIALLIFVTTDAAGLCFTVILSQPLPAEAPWRQR